MPFFSRKMTPSKRCSTVSSFTPQKCRSTKSEPIRKISKLCSPRFHKWVAPCNTWQPINGHSYVQWGCSATLLLQDSLEAALKHYVSIVANLSSHRQMQTLLSLLHHAVSSSVVPAKYVSSSSAACSSGISILLGRGEKFPLAKKVNLS